MAVFIAHGYVYSLSVVDISPESKCRVLGYSLQTLVSETLLVRGHPSVSLLPLSSPLLSPCSYVSPTPLYYLQGPYLKFDNSSIRRSDDFLDVDSPDIIDFPLLPPLIPQQHRTSLGCIGTGPCDTTAPSAITWIPIYGRLGTRRLGTVILCISFVV
jgi:hypothetical protein